MTPSLVWACGFCSDAIFKAEHWWATAIGWTFLALLICSFALVAFNKPNFGLITPIAGFGIAAACVFVAGPNIAAWVSSAVMLVALMVSLVIHKLPRWYNVVRVALVLTAMGVGFIRAEPENRSTKELLQVAVYVKQFPPSPSWLYGELLSRADTRELLEQQLMFEKSGNPKAVELHRELGFPAEVRREACHTLREEEREKACPGE